MRFEGGVAKYTITEAAETFFDYKKRTVQWLRWRERTKVFLQGPEGHGPIEIERTRPETGERRYKLDDIELITKSLLEYKKIKQDEYDAIMERIAAQRQIEEAHKSVSQIQTKAS
ncbi:hypothetical protein [Streptomyces sp. CoH17]|uniref:DUF7229 domain-containing protein n=1 Tax=Streptomyces sp. CoH17 TaxID=2992806 RepID=UPI00226E996A|nr:hypothetical protein [Streptomyces sp. CoH17]